MALEAQQQRDRDQHGPGEISPRPRGRGGSRWPVDDPRSAQAEDSPRARAPTPPERAPNKRRIVEVPPEREERPEQDRERGDAPGRGLLRRHPFAFVIGLVLFILAAAGGYLYWDYARHFESTDDAFVAARQFPIAPKVSGYITLVPVTDNQHVAAGDVIARIDDRDYRIALDQAQAQVASAEANIQNIDAQINVQLSYTIVTAAQAGRVVQLSAAAGQFAQPGTNLTMFVPDEIWITANFKETQLDTMRPGQPVTLEIDAYPERAIRGHVDSVQPGSGTAFSLLPAQNATGNYVKIVQRVPVKLVMDNPPKDVALGPGMSVVPTVRVNPAPSIYERLLSRYEQLRAWV